MSGRSQSQRLATQLREFEITAKDKFPTWDENARSYYGQLKEKEKIGKLVPGSLNHYLYHTHLHNMRDEKLQNLKEQTNAQSAAAGKPKKAPAAGKTPKATAKAVKGSDIESSDDPSRSTLEPAPGKSVEARARKDNADAADAADSPQTKQIKSSGGNDKLARNKNGKYLCCTNSNYSISKIMDFSLTECWLYWCR